MGLMLGEWGVNSRLRRLAGSFGAFQVFFRAATAKGHEQWDDIVDMLLTGKRGHPKS